MKPYRKNVGIVVFNARGLLLGGERVHYPGTLQFPQGGLDAGEEPEAAACRELYDEIGLKLEQPLAALPEWLRYDFPDSIPDHLKSFQGQEQKWFYFFWDGDLTALSLDHHEREFERLAWVKPDEMLSSVVTFKKAIYARVLEYGIKVMTEHLGPCACFDLKQLKPLGPGQTQCHACGQKYLRAHYELDHTCVDGSWIFLKRVIAFPEPMPAQLDAFIQDQRPYFAYKSGESKPVIFW